MLRVVCIGVHMCAYVHLSSRCMYTMCITTYLGQTSTPFNVRVQQFYCHPGCTVYSTTHGTRILPRCNSQCIRVTTLSHTVHPTHDMKCYFKDRSARDIHLSSKSCLRRRVYLQTHCIHICTHALRDTTRGISFCVFEGYNPTPCPGVN